LLLAFVSGFDGITMNRTLKHVLATTVILILLMAGAIAVFIGTGVYNFAADVPHTELVSNLIETMRERSIETRIASIQVPDIADDAAILRGAGNYDAMCVQCHRAPGINDTELSRGLYPSPPNLSKESPGAAHAFWVIKHGVKASGMPAWGKSMSDKDLWDLAGFLQVLPKLDEPKYRAMVGKSGGHSHGPGDSHGRSKSSSLSPAQAGGATSADHDSPAHR
jgi:mono/diheme cytochrome c family protein